MEASVSVIIPAHNAALTIEHCLRKLAESAVKYMQVVVVDDGSTDDTATIASTFPGIENLVVIRQAQSGTSAARNVGISRASGEYIMFVDADDSVVPDSLNGFIEFAYTSAADITIADFSMKEPARDVAVSNINTHKHHFDQSSAEVFQWLCLTSIGFGRKKNIGLLGAPWAKIYRSEFVRNVAPTEPFRVGVARGQDVLFNVEMFGLARTVAYYPHVVYRYVISPDSYSHRPSTDFVSRAEILVSHLTALVAKYRWDHLNPAIDKLSVVLLEEGIKRLGPRAASSDLIDLARHEPFAGALRRTRARDYSIGGLVKMLLLRSRLYATYRRAVGLNHVVRARA